MNIIEQSASRLAQIIAAGELSSVEVVEAHLRRIETVNPTLNAIVVPLFDQAVADAKEADQRRARGESLGPLHGVPVTIKEMFDVEGAPTTAGLPTRGKHEAERDAVAVAHLKRAGAIVLGKTNVPQMGMMPDASNPHYGRTKNPWNGERTPGGSSGGEAAIIAAGGSPLGIGSDGGGSIRQPSASCGIAGLKPTGRRLSFRGHWYAPNWLVDWASAGPMARAVDDLGLALECLANKPGDPPEANVNAAPIPDYRTVDVDQLRVGYYTQLGWMKPSPAVARAVNEAAGFLESDGVEVQPFEPPDVQDGWDLYFSLFYSDACRYLRRQARGTPLDWRVKRILQFTLMPTILRPVFAAGFRLTGNHSFAHTLGAVSKRMSSAADYNDLLERQDRYRVRFGQAMQDAGVDALIGPPNPVVAVTPTEFDALYGMMFTGLFNLLGFPAGVVPATRVRADEEQTERTRDAVDRSFARIETGSAGLPVGVHVAAPWWREDVTLAVMKRLESHFRSSSDFPVTPHFDP